MIKVPNYNVVVPVTPDLVVFGQPRPTVEGNRKHLTFETNVDNISIIELPWMPVAQDWVEIYKDGIRIINPRIKSATGGMLFEIYNVKNNFIIFNKPVSGLLKIICDTEPVHYWGSLIIQTDNVQGPYIYADAQYVNINNWKIKTGYAKGRSYTIFIEPGPEYLVGSDVKIRGCKPDIFNGIVQVRSSTADSISFVSNTFVPNTQLLIPGTISGFGNVTYKQLQGISLYAEPIIITQPVHGYARLTTDRKSIAYVPNTNYVGNDTFSWSMINQHGQIGVPKCVHIIIRPLSYNLNS